MSFLLTILNILEQVATKLSSQRIMLQAERISDFHFMEHMSNKISQNSIKQSTSAFKNNSNLKPIWFRLLSGLNKYTLLCSSCK